MSRANATRDAWHPLNKQDQDAVLLELEQILASSHFSNSKRYPALLRYIVEKTLAGGSDLLKERTLGVEVFDRPLSYDTNADTVVRYTAGEVRKRLSLYYHELDRKPAVHISLPAGSYVPEFLRAHDEHEPPLADQAIAQSGRLAQEALPPVRDMDLPEPQFQVPGERAAGTEDGTRPAPPPPHGSGRPRAHSRRWAIAATIGLVAIAAFSWAYRSARSSTALDEFWEPVLRDQRAVLLCTGGTTIVPNTPTGFTTADKSTEYPYVSIQIASSIARLSSMLEQRGATTELRAAASTPLTDMRERPVILLGGYNSPWTTRLLQPLRFHFSPEPATAIVDATQPGVRWERNHSLPYSSADDYALVARYRDATTDAWVIALAGVGRNGTEAASQFATSPHYLQMLKDRVGGGFSNRNVEAVLKVSVIDGRTGAPSIVAVHAW